MSDDEALAEQTERELREALARHEEERLRHEETIEASAARVAAAADGVARGLARYKAALDLVDRRFPMALARILYWEHPDVKVAQIAPLIGVGAHEVYLHMGEHTIERECRGRCGRTLTREAKHRTDAASTGNDWRWCDECREERTRRNQEAERRRAASHDRYSAAEARMLDEALAAGVRPARLYAELPGVPGTWPVDPETGEPTHS